MLADETVRNVIKQQVAHLALVGGIVAFDKFLILYSIEDLVLTPTSTFYNHSAFGLDEFVSEHTAFFAIYLRFADDFIV